jgi:hypothetical protein
MGAQDLGPSLNIDAFRGKVYNRIYRIGIELEGGWIKLPPGVRQLQHDGSVQIEPQAGIPLQIGELAIGPITLQEWPRWLKTHYPQKVNQTCGMHVHLQTTTSLAYARLMDARYPATVIDYFKRWSTREGLSKDHPIWNRLRGKSVYCQHLYMADDQIRNNSKDHDRARPGHRYTVINYCHGRYGTVECRLLPMMDTVDQAERAIQEFVDITNGFLRATRKKEIKVSVSTEADAAVVDDMEIIIPPNSRVRRRLA